MKISLPALAIKKGNCRKGPICYPPLYKNCRYLKLTKLISGLSMNILRAGNKSPVQRGFFTYSAFIACPRVSGQAV